MSEATETSAGKRRPTAEDLPGILEDILDGLSLRKACVKAGLHPGHTQAMFAADDRLWAQYVRCRAMQGDDQGHRVGELAEQIVEGIVQPDVGRAAMQGLMWSASRMNRKLWGDKLAHEMTGAGGGPIQTFDLSQVSDDDLERLEAIMKTAAATETAPPET